MMVDPVTAQAAIPARQVELAPAMPQQAGQDAAADFAASLKVAATEHIGGTDMSPALRGMLGTLDKVNGEAKSVADYARSVEGTGGELTPGEVVQPVVGVGEMGQARLLEESLTLSQEE